MKNIWDTLSEKYLDSVSKDEDSVYAYEKLVNSLSLLSLCDNSGKVLDLGCGDGRFTKDLEARYEKVYGVDCSERLLKIAKLRCPKTSFFKFDLEEKFKPLGTKFDLITSKLVLMYINNIENFATETYKVLNTGGILAISVTHPFKWIHEFQKGNLDNKSFKGYLYENFINWKVAQDDNLLFEFKNRTLQTYINTFTKYGFSLETIIETGVPDSFVIKYPNYLISQNRPYRLNMKFIKK